ncbi:MAG: IS110 family transposase, partial [Verrucomicrobiota bacterium]
LAPTGHDFTPAFTIDESEQGVRPVGRGLIRNDSSGVARNSLRDDLAIMLSSNQPLAWKSLQKTLIITDKFIIMKNSSYAAFVGIDRSDASIDLTILDQDTSYHGHHAISSKPNSLRDWIASLRKEFPSGQIALCIEQPCANLAFFFCQYDFIDLYLINPSTFKNWREAFQPSRAKNDKSDSRGIAELVSESHHKLKVWQADNVHTRKLRSLVEARRNFVDMRTKVNNQLVALLKGYYPEALDLTGKYLHAPLACRFLEKWPTLQALKKASPGEIREFYHLNHSRRASAIEKRLTIIDEAIPLTDDSAILEASCLHLTALVNQFDALRKSIASYDSKIEALFEQHEDSRIFASLPGAGPNLGARLLTFFGTDRSKFTHASAAQNFGGISPVTKQSGNSRVIHRRYACPKFHRQTFLEWVGQTITRSIWAKAFFQQQKAKGVSHYSALRALAYKWIRIIWRCWQDRNTYCEETYIKALRSTGSPLIPSIDLLIKGGKKL